MKNVIYFNFQTKTQDTRPVKELTDFELNSIDARIEELSQLFDTDLDDDVFESLENELNQLMTRLRNSEQLILNRQNQQRLKGKRKKGLKPKIVS